MVPPKVALVFGFRFERYGIERNPVTFTLGTRAPDKLLFWVLRAALVTRNTAQIVTANRTLLPIVRRHIAIL
jgi:hypothetical protein